MKGVEALGTSALNNGDDGAAGDVVTLRRGGGGGSPRKETKAEKGRRGSYLDVAEGTDLTAMYSRASILLPCKM